MKNRYFAHNQKTYFIAEIGINHNGDVNNALKLVEEAKKAGCDAVKFQKRYPRDCVPKKIWNIKRSTPWGEMTYIDYKHKVEFGKKEYDIIDRYCKQRNISWSASPWDLDSLEFLNNYDIPYIKIPSNYNLNNLPDNSGDFIDSAKPSMDTKSGNHFIPSRSTHLNEVNQEVFDLQTYKKFLSFLKFQEMMDKYNT